MVDAAVQESAAADGVGRWTTCAVTTGDAVHASDLARACPGPRARNATGTILLALMVACSILLGPGAAAADTANTADTADMTGVAAVHLERPGAVAGSLVVTYRRPVTGGASADIAAPAAAEGAVVEGAVGSHAVELRVPARRAAAIAAVLARRPGVLAVESNVRAEVAAVTDDPLLVEQEGITRAGVDVAWDATRGDAEVKIAVIDTGVDVTHPDLVDNATAGYNVLDGSTDVRDVHGHGTASASVAAATSGNGIGIAGVCGRCRVMPVKALGDDGYGDLADVARGVAWATAHGADVISMSLSGHAPLAALSAAIADAQAQGVVVVAAAGNLGSTARRYPAAEAGVIAVAALADRSDALADYSNHSPEWVDVAAPGLNKGALAGTDGFRDFHGTSSAAPVVAGIVGLLRSAGATGPEAVTAVSTTSHAADSVTWGRIDAGAAMERVSPRSARGADPGRTPPEPSTSDPAPAPPGDPAPPGPVGPPSTDPGTGLLSAPGVHRVSGPDRMATGVALSSAWFGAGVRRAYVATGWGFADGLAAAGAAGRDGAPVLITRPDRLPDGVAAELRRLAPQEIVVLGGERAVGDRVLTALGGIAPTRRISGSTRYATAARVALEGGRTTRALLASGEDFPDALAAGGVAAGIAAPVLLSPARDLADPTRDALERLGVEEVVVLGGHRAIAPEVEEELSAMGLAVTRLHGDDRYATAAQLATTFHDSAELVFLTSGESYADALGAGAAAGRMSAPLLVTRGTSLPDATAAALGELAPRRVVVVGGDRAVEDAVLERVDDLLGG